MPGLICEFCDKKFAQSCSRLRHERTIHLNMLGDDEPDSEDALGSGSEVSEIDDNEQTAKDFFWRVIIGNARDLLHEQITAGDVLNEPHLSRLVEVIGKLIQSYIAISTYMENHDRIYGSVNGRAQKYEAGGMTKSEANDTAWYESRQLIREIIDENIDLFE